jgi:mannose-1-phosphate guanylyltransferase
MFIRWRDPVASFCLLPADHFIDPAAGFQEALGRAFEAAERGRVPVTFGIVPDRPATQYGYIERGESVEQGFFGVRRFREKPDRTAAEAMLREGRWFWNSGMFVWRAEDLLAAVRAHLPEHQRMIDAVAPALGTSRLPATLASEYAKLPRISIDYGIMEKVSGTLVLPAPFRWNDLGTWSALREVRPRDRSGNVLEGNVVALDSRDSVVLTDGDHLVATFGVEGIVVIRTADATLVCRLDRAEDLKRVVEKLRQEGRERFL